MCFERVDIFKISQTYIHPFPNHISIRVYHGHSADIRVYYRSIIGSTFSFSDTSIPIK